MSNSYETELEKEQAAEKYRNMESSCSSVEFVEQESIRKEKEKRGRGRPTDYSDERAEQICRLIANHSEGLRTLREMYPSIMPNCETFYDWINAHPYFSELYAKAKVKQISADIERIREVCTVSGKSLAETAEARLEIDTKKWFACKLVPKVYGERVTQEVDATLNVKSYEEAQKMDQDQVARAYKDLMG